jgi:two-component SAPR family response regulator
MFFDKSGGQLLMYDFEHNYPTRFDPATKTWNNNNDTLTWIRFMHHNKYYDEVNHVVYTFGGYGFHKYSALFQRFTEATQQWESFDLSASIHPRYLAAMGALNDSLLLCFGGYGNASGMQQELPHNYYDLYSINPQTLNVVKLWDKEYVGEHFANSNSLIINRRNRTFYTLSYPQNIYESQLTLHEYSLDEPHVRRLGNPVPYLFHDVASYCDLFMPSDSSALYAVTSHLDGDNSCIEIYSISYPPLSLAETLQTPKEKKSVLYVITVLILSLIVLSAVFWLLRLVAKRKQANAVLKVIETANATEDAAEKSSLPVPYPSLNVLGRFEVFDATGMNITHLFTPTTRQMFFLLYFRSLNEGKGITSNELQKTLWPDRDYDSARNNRNVYFNRLRPLLNYIGNIHLIRTDNSWSLQFDESEIYSDYLRALNSLALLKEQTEPDRELLTATLQIIRSGKLLPLRDFEWLDNYKTHYANIVIETLTHISSSAAIRKDLPLLLNIAEAILLQDDTEEYAIKLKCSILFKIGKKKQALQCYNKFAEEYFALLNAQPDLSFNEMVSE